MSESDILKFIEVYPKESLFVEYKVKDRSGKFTDSDKNNFSKTLSSFGNSEGGILIWGVADVSKNVRMEPIDQIKEFDNRLRSFLAESTIPTLQGFLMEDIFINSENTGYVKCFIPQSDIAPHQARDGKYYFRTMEGVLPMRHYQILDMLGKRQKPFLHMIIKPQVSSTVEGENNLEFAVQNKGRVCAKYYGFICHFDNNIELIITPDSKVKDITKLNDGRPTIMYENNIGVIHPSEVIYQLDILRYRSKDKRKKIKGELIYYCEGMASQKIEFIINKSTINYLTI